LPGLDLESALNASDKIRMKNCFSVHRVPIPHFMEISSKRQLFETAAEFGLPVVIKPVDSRGARGVQRIKETKQLEQAFDIAKKYSPQGRVMMEKFLEGPQLSTEGFMLNGKAFIPAVFDRNYEYIERYAPFIVENGGEMPSIYTEKYVREIHDVMEKAAISMGIGHGVIKGDLVIHEGRIKVIELAARLSGGFFGTVATPVSCGVNLIKTNIRLCLGEDIHSGELEPQLNRASAIRFSFPQAGRIRRISGLRKVLSDPACGYAHVFAKENDVLSPISNHPERPAVVVSEGRNLDEAVLNAGRLINSICFDVVETERS
jgi:biotin carboxylase